MRCVLLTVAGAGLPGREHEALARLVGDWDVLVDGPGDVRIGSGSAHMTLEHGGRFLRIDLSLEIAGVPTSSTGFLGFDRDLGEYQSLWLSDLSSAMSLTHGRGSLTGQGISLSGVAADSSGRSLLRLLGDDELEVDVLGVGPDGAERRLRRSRYLRGLRCARTACA